MTTPQTIPAVFIPAVSKGVSSQVSLIRKLCGKNMIQRAIDKARSLAVDSDDIHIVTDSEEINLIGAKNCVSCHYYPDQSWLDKGNKNSLSTYIQNAENGKRATLVLSPYATLLTGTSLVEAIDRFYQDDCDVLQPTRIERQHRSKNTGYTIEQLIGTQTDQEVFFESKAFLILRPGILTGDLTHDLKIEKWVMNEEATEIQSLHEWWISEKILSRKRIVFRVIGNDEVGMGHIYRAKTLAHEMYDHEVIFVTNSGSQAAVKKLIGSEYGVCVFSWGEIVKGIIELSPDLVINDMLDTNSQDINMLREKRIKVVNFEDLGTGAAVANLTINELYDSATMTGSNMRWGYDYFFVREEFEYAEPRQFNKKVTSILLTFGGTDQHNMSQAIYQAVWELCKQLGITIHVVTGPGYAGYEELSTNIANNGGASITHATGVISHIMEQTQLAITSNGRTVYELAHMNIPSIVIPQHDREKTHSFATEANGFVQLKTYSRGKTEKDVHSVLQNLLTNNEYRYQLFQNMTKYSFIKNKQRVLNEILNELHPAQTSE